MLQEGNLDRTSPGTTLLQGAHAPKPVSGHLKMDITVLQAFSGDCADDMTELAACYQNGTGCDADQLARAQLFSLYVQTGALDIHNASKINGLVYIVHLE